MKLYYSNIAEFGDLNGSELLSAERKQKMERYVHIEDQARCLVAGLMLRYVLGECAIFTGPNGKPYADAGIPYFNVSHSGDYVVLAVAGCEVGLDIEKVAPYSDAITKKCFTKSEQNWLSMQNSINAFYKLWTGKESVMKASGLGFLMPPESFCVLPVENGGHCICKKMWYLQWFSCNGHEICTATAAPEQAEQLLYVRRSELLGGSL